MPRKGENIFKRKDGRWEGRYVKAHDGKKIIYGYVYGKSYSEVKKKKSEAVKKIRHEKPRRENFKPSKSPNFENIARQWLEELKPIRKKSTIVKYMSQLKNYIIPEFGKFNLSDIGNEDIISFANILKALEKFQKLLHRDFEKFLINHVSSSSANAKQKCSIGFSSGLYGGRKIIFTLYCSAIS